MARYSKWLGLLGLILLVWSCSLPWTYHADLGKYFTGYFTENNIYGRPARLLLPLAAISVITNFTPVMWMKFAGMLVASLNMAYAFSRFLKFGSAYLGYVPEKESGLYLMLLSVSLIFIASFLPYRNAKRAQKKEGSN
jgi:hypothetical protein